MRILFHSEKGDGAWFVWLLGQHHDVDWVCTDENYRGSLGGIIKPPLATLPNPSKYELVVFDASGSGALADEAKLVTPTIGASELADKLEDDRVFGLEFMEQCGINVPEWEAFDDRKAAISYTQKRGKRLVLKPIDDFDNKALTYVSKSPDDMVQFIEALPSAVKGFVLQDFVVGTEVATEAWWTGSEWVALNHTLEEKKFMSGNIGPNTGCAGNVLWMPERKNALFEQGLEKVGAALAEHYPGWVGNIDLNTIVTEGSIYGLEWTPRFGYEGTCNLAALLPIEFGEFLHNIATGSVPTNLEAKAKFAATIRVSVPPYPNLVLKNKWVEVPIKGVPEDLSKFVLYDAMVDETGMHTEGNYNAIGTPLCTGETIKGVFESVEAVIGALEIPDLQWRNDLSKCVEKRYTTLVNYGWLRPIG